MQFKLHWNPQKSGALLCSQFQPKPANLDAQSNTKEERELHVIFDMTALSEWEY